MPPRDAWQWGVLDVITWVRQDLPVLAAEIPNAKLPDIEVLATAFEEQDVSGHVLLCDVTTDFLKAECGIRALGRRSTILEAIRMLRKNSTEYRSRNDPGPPTAASIAPHAQPPTPTEPVTTKPIADTKKQMSTPPAKSTTVLTRRPREELVVDERGRKRRKLNLVTNSSGQTSDPSTITQPQPALSRSHLPDKKTTVDDLIYGETAIGEITLANMEQTNGKLFTFTGSHCPPGLSLFAARRLRSLFQAPSVVEITWKGEQRFGLRPYDKRGVPPNLQPSLTFFQGLEDDDPAIRIHQSDIGLEGSSEDAQQDGGFWGPLLEKYNEDDDKILPPLGESEDLSDVDSEFAAELEAEEETPSSEFLSETEAAEVFEDVVEQYVERWKEKKLDRLEKNEAHKTWNSVRRSGARRKQIAAINEQQLTHLEERLSKMRRDILQIQWTSDEELVKQCQIIQLTVEDMEELRWKRSVWMRTQAPLRPERSGVSKPRIDTPHQAAVSPVEAAEPLDDDMEEFISDHDDSHDTQSLPELELPAREDADIAMDDAPGSQSRSAADGASSELDPLDMGDLKDAAAQSDGDTSFLPSDGTLPVLRRQNRISDSDDSMPEPKSQPQPKLESKPSTRTQWQTTSQEVIQISSDTETPPPEKPTIKHNFLGKDPENALGSEIGSWDMDILKQANDRKRVISKLLFSLEYEYKQELADSISSEPKPATWLTTHIRSVLDQKAGRHSTPVTHIDLQFAKLYACWHECNADLWDKAVPEEIYKHVDELDVDMKSWAAYTAVVVPKIANFLVPGGTYDLQEEDEDDVVVASPGKRPKKKKIKLLDAKAAESRNDAKTRMKRFAESQHQSSNLSQMDILGSDDRQDEVELNLIRGKKDKVIYMNPITAKRLKRHQIEGVQFLWREVMAEGDGGCILAHTMGLGKTCQTISFLASLKEAGEDSETRKQIPKAMRPVRALVLSPPAVLPNWIREIEMWSPRSGFFNVFKIDSTGTDQQERFAVLQKWYNSEGILLMGYPMFARLVLIDDENEKDRKPSSAAESEQDGSRENSTDADAAEESTQRGSKLTKKQRMQASQMLTEGPNVVIADEAHKLGNEKTKTSLAAAKIKNAKRVALSGTPLSNATREIFSLVNWVAPNYLGSKSEFEYRFAKPIEAGIFSESTSYQKRLSLKKLTILRNETEPKIHRMDITALKGSLGSKTEYNLTVPLTPLQMDLYKRYISFVTGAVGGEKVEVTNMQLFGWISLLVLLCTHPKALRNKLVEDSAPKKKKSRPSLDADGSHNHTANEDDTEVIGDEPVSKLGLSTEMTKELVDLIPEDADVSSSCRMTLIQQILELSKKAGDKTLVFSHRLPLLDCMEELLDKMKITFGRIDGSTSQPNREAVLTRFRNGEYDVLLISTRAGGQGLNMQVANRVIIVDFGYNPTWEEQAVGRAYRLGQKKDVFVYRFVSGGTFEDKLYNMGLFKSSLFQRVVDKKNPERHAKRSLSDWLFPPRDVQQQTIDVESGSDKLVLDKIIAPQLDGRKDSYIRNIKTMETLLRDADDEPLTEEEQREVRKEIAMMEQQRKNPNARPSFLSTPYVPAGLPSTAPGALNGIPVGGSAAISKQPAPAQANGTPRPRMPNGPSPHFAPRASISGPPPSTAPNRPPHAINTPITNSKQSPRKELTLDMITRPTPGPRDSGRERPSYSQSPIVGNGVPLPAPHRVSSPNATPLGPRNTGPPAQNLNLWASRFNNASHDIPNLDPWLPPVGAKSQAGPGAQTVKQPAAFSYPSSSGRAPLQPTTSAAETSSTEQNGTGP
ncbi:Protein CHROMATIN REMODELING 20 [Elsinoe australis]|uniref:Protein CHROMATIN REMODELING 20 n=1 Tax=Elsinoe australis TaxID=40998 RepID=A0A2P8A7Z3_9PEZI|nr:Protein CHROMATIN REMODELING 20 [Elsinoe australis]